MYNQFHAIYDRDGEWYIGYCPDIPEANSQGKSIDECRKSLIDAIKLVIQDRLSEQN